MSINNKQARYFWSICVLVGLVSSGCASTQVTNNSGSLFTKATVGPVEFNEGLDYCADGCSTGFKRVRTGENSIFLRVNENSPWKNIGYLGPFEKDTYYSVSIRKGEKEFCAELWKRYDTDSTFNDDTTKILIESLCPN